MKKKSQLPKLINLKKEAEKLTKEVNEQYTDVQIRTEVVYRKGYSILMFIKTDSEGIIKVIE